LRWGVEKTISLGLKFFIHTVAAQFIHHQLIFILQNGKQMFISFGKDG